MKIFFVFILFISLFCVFRTFGLNSESRSLTFKSLFHNRTRRQNDVFLPPLLDHGRDRHHYQVCKDNNCRPQQEQHGGDHGIHVASWKWDEIGVFFAFTAFIVITGLAKVAFHHAHWLSSRVPESCLLIIIGVVVGTILFFSGVSIPENNGDRVVADEEFALPTFTPRLFFLVLLPPVILESAYSLYDRAFADNLYTVLLYAVVGTLINTFMIGPLLYLIANWGMMGYIYLQLSDAIVFSALISAVDPVAVLAIFQEVGVNKDLYYLVFGESLLNDAVTIVLYTTAVTFATMPVIDGSQYGLAILAFFTVSLGGLAIGCIFGLVTALITKTTQDVRVVEPLAVLGIAYLSYLAAELFHFSGIISIIGCGLVQAHYAFKNISDNSKITVKYFTKMISSTSDAVIFLFLGMVLVSNRHIWHTGFVLWTLLLCLVCRFFGVFLLTAIANRFRVKKINFQEQFIMAYGGLRGAVAFSLVEMLNEDIVGPQRIFLTTTLVVILFTVFIQGATIKLFVNLLRIQKSETSEKTMNQEMNEHVICTLMAGIEEITGVRGDYYIRRKFEYFDETYLSKIFLNTVKANNLTRLYEKLALTQHYAHLYGPVTLVEDQKTLALHTDTTERKKKFKRSMSARVPNKIIDNFSGVQLRRRTFSDTSRPSDSPFVDTDVETSTEQLRQAFRNSTFQRYQGRYDRKNIVDEDMDLSNLLRRRHNRTRRITQTAAMMNRHSATPTTDGHDPDEEFAPHRRQIHSELEATFPEDLEGIKHILDRAQRRVTRHSSNVEVFSNEMKNSRRHTTSETTLLQQQQPLLDSYNNVSPRSGQKLRKAVGSPDSVHYKNVRRQHSVVTKHPETKSIKLRSPPTRRHYSDTSRNSEDTQPAENEESDESKL